MCMICLQIPNAPIKEILLKDLPADWQINPPPDILKLYGDTFAAEKKFFALKVPSAIIPEESNYILNPNHRDYNKVRIIYNRSISIDERFFTLQK